MEGRYSAFTFCDRIVEYVPAQRAGARFLIPAGVGEFPPCLVAEAVGQLAAWVSMAHIGFRGRPVAALSREARLLGEVAPGQTLELAVDIESCDEETVAYHGHAAVAGRRVCELVECVAPMLPQDDYDSPADLAGQFELLLGAGARPGRFPGVPPLPLTTLERNAGVSSRARLDVPKQAPYFADHFPRRPVFPATLLLDSAIRVARDVGGTDPQGRALQPVGVTRLKMRDWTLPGQSVEIEARNIKNEPSKGVADLVMRVGERTVATARIEFATVAEALQ